MNKLVIYLCSLSLLCGVVSCGDIDNRDAPESTIKGEIIDVTTNSPLITEQPNGFRIQLMEYSWSKNPTPLYFWGRADGTFQNTKLFSGSYGVKPIEGAFFDVEEKIVEVSGTATVVFEVTPYLVISEPSIEKLSPTSIKVSYNISRPKKGGKIIETQVFITDKTPNVGANAFVDNLSPIVKLDNIDDDVILGTTYTQTIEGLDTSKTYYMRVGAKTDRGQKRNNFTKVIKLEL